MMVLIAIPSILSCLALAAHFYRGMFLPGVVVYLVLPLILLVRRNAAVRVVQLGLMIGALIWLSTALTIVQARQAEGGNWIRPMCIMLGVECFTIFSAVLLNKLLVRGPQAEEVAP